MCSKYDARKTTLWDVLELDNVMSGALNVEIDRHAIACEACDGVGCLKRSNCVETYLSDEDAAEREKSVDVSEEETQDVSRSGDGYVISLRERLVKDALVKYNNPEDRDVVLDSFHDAYHVGGLCLHCSAIYAVRYSHMSKRLIRLICHLSECTCNENPYEKKRVYDV